MDHALFEFSMQNKDEKSKNLLSLRPHLVHPQSFSTHLRDCLKRDKIPDGWKGQRSKQKASKLV